MPDPSPRLYGDDVTQLGTRGVGVYDNGFVEISGPCGIDYTNCQIEDWRALNTRIEQLAEQAGL